MSDIDAELIANGFEPIGQNKIEIESNANTPLPEGFDISRMTFADVNKVPSEQLTKYRSKLHERTSRILELKENLEKSSVPMKTESLSQERTEEFDKYGRLLRRNVTNESIKISQNVASKIIASKKQND